MGGSLLLLAYPGMTTLNEHWNLGHYMTVRAGVRMGFGGLNHADDPVGLRWLPHRETCV